MEKKYIAVFLLVVISAASLVSGQALAESNDMIILGEADWPGIRAKNAVAVHVLETIGYSVETQTGADPIMYQGLAQGDIDAYLGSWMPSMENTRKELKDKINVVATNMDEGIYTMAVPEYVWEAGVRSYADLDKHADKFNHKMYVGPAGWASSKTMAKAVKKDIYGLGDWQAVNSSQSAMMAQVKRSVRREEWIVFIGWQPHWMNYILDIKYLKDPKGLWVSPESWVDTITRTGFKEDHPEVNKFLKQFKVDVEANDKWIYEVGKNSRDSKEVAREWITENMDVVKGWLEGVKAQNGKKAAEVLEEKLTE
ncbi:ABC transporter substrate-binding protein [Acetohalobium arabaticum]|uniref:Substrate-binding region of ABC-type glycine betaine transport system n=1 Tax=Acetohalobium arabaticum (strain ATCC 49924 / DSM 5501 / Z-7288) TaxID=574087 RepID=D9QU27_ACEAZ|nr:ABC transporter substrate-binding protein [Acetohalobium arabaticum]ADL13748.1 Substrate-binding region of ABC-type glycine betaine transport system [Acetohalobium arabaticum DSM 5501]